MGRGFLSVVIATGLPAVFLFRPMLQIENPGPLPGFPVSIQNSNCVRFFLKTRNHAYGAWFSECRDRDRVTCGVPFPSNVANRKPRVVARVPCFHPKLELCSVFPKNKEPRLWGVVF